MTARAGAAMTTLTPQKLTAEELSRLAVLLSSATRLPWGDRRSAVGVSAVCDEDGVWFATGPGHAAEDFDGDLDRSNALAEQAAERDCALIREACNRLPALLAQIATAEAEARVWYGPNGPETLATAEEVVERRKAAAAEIVALRSERDKLAAEVERLRGACVVSGPDGYLHCLLCRRRSSVFAEHSAVVPGLYHARECALYPPTASERER